MKLLLYFLGKLIARQRCLHWPIHIEISLVLFSECWLVELCLPPGRCPPLFFPPPTTQRLVRIRKARFRRGKLRSCTGHCLSINFRYLWKSFRRQLGRSCNLVNVLGTRPRFINSWKLNLRFLHLFITELIWKWFGLWFAVLLHHWMASVYYIYLCNTERRLHSIAYIKPIVPRRYNIFLWAALKVKIKLEKPTIRVVRSRRLSLGAPSKNPPPISPL